MRRIWVGFQGEHFEPSGLLDNLLDILLGILLYIWSSQFIRNDPGKNVHKNHHKAIVLKNSKRL